MGHELDETGWKVFSDIIKRRMMINSYKNSNHHHHHHGFCLTTHPTVCQKQDVDADGSGVIDYTEFLAATLDRQPKKEALRIRISVFCIVNNFFFCFCFVFDNHFLSTET